MAKVTYDITVSFLDGKKMTIMDATMYTYSAEQNVYTVVVKGKIIHINASCVQYIGPIDDVEVQVYERQDVTV